jgi:hypothetical protein
MRSNTKDKRHFLRHGFLGLFFLFAFVLPVPIYAAGQYNAAGTQKLHGHVPAVVAQLQPVGNLSGSQRLRLAIGLPLRNQTMLTELLQRIYNPASPDYHHYLTPEQFAKMFGPTEQDYQAVVTFAKTHGLTVTGTHPNRTLLDVDGSVADIEKAMHVTMRVYKHPTEARTFYAPDVEPSLDLAVPVLHINGLDNYFLPKPLLHKMSASQATPALGSGHSGSYMGNDFRAAYAPGVTLTGAGQSVGLMEFCSGFYQSDINAYEAEANLPNVPVVTVLLDGYDGGPGNNNDEVSLDIEMAISMAPGLTSVVVYEEGYNSLAVDVLSRMAEDNWVKQLGSSWGFPIYDNEDQIFQQFAAQGQSFFCASGDSGAYCGPINSSAEDPYITIVGGTTLTTGSDGSWVSETTWPDSGGGISTVYPIPWWQQGVNMSDNKGSTTMRNIPDVAMVACNIFVIYGNGHESSSFGGTSCAVPLWAAFTALVNQQTAACGGPVGFINPAVYAIGGGTNYTSCFHDITTGCNTDPCCPGKFCAVPGYDLRTGWGTPTGQNLINALLAFPSSSCACTLSDDLNGDCVGPGREINYTIDYNYPAGPFPDIDADIIDNLPAEVDFNSASGPNYVHSGSNTVIWHIGTLHPGDSVSVTLKVNVKSCVEPNITITNKCNIISSGQVLCTAYDYTLVCPVPTLTEVDNITGCANPDSDVNYTINDVNYTICYNAHGYGDTNVMITDNLPRELGYISSNPAGTYHPDTNTVTWNIAFPPDALGCITLTAQINHNAVRGGTITNYCELKGNCFDINNQDTISVCPSWCPIYVDANATGGNNGYSWPDAFTNLQDALKTAKDFNCNEIRVAQGIYWPDINSAHPNGTANRQATFQLINGVTIYGGFPVGGGTLEGRNPAAYATILSGDLLGNDREVNEPCDLLNDPCRADNSFHVVTGSGTNQTAILDGFTITDGDANGNSPYDSGGGMYNNNGSPIVKNCKFIKNAAQYGGGIDSNSEDSNETIANCTFIENVAYSHNGGQGGGIYISNSNSYIATVTNCTFNRNSASGGEDCYSYGYCDYYIGSGGGIYNTTGNLTVTNCTFSGNSASGGEDCYGNGSCNYHDGSGGGIYNTTGNLTVTNCTFNENLVLSGSGGGIWDSGDMNITNCTVVANEADSSGGGIYLQRLGHSVKVTNSILWGNEGGQIAGDANVTYSDIDGNWPGVGNIDKYPMFGPDGWHLSMCSPCIDAGTNTPAGGLPATDIDGEARIMNGRCVGADIVDMGADEYYLEDCNTLLYAHCQKPACNVIAALYVGGDPNIKLTWCPGRLAASQDVYFGTTFKDVNNATTATTATPVIYKGRQSEPNYLAVGLKAGATYYWRIDEVNGTNIIWPGSVCCFRTGLFIDDFERYNSFADLNANWQDGYTITHTGADAGCNSATAKGYAGRDLIQDATGGKHLQYTFNNDGANPAFSGASFSETKISYSGGVSFTGGGDISPEPNTLRIDYKGRATNAANNLSGSCPAPLGGGDLDRMYVAIEDSAGDVAIYLNPNSNAQRVTNWTSWYTALKDINDLAHGTAPDGSAHTVNLEAITGFSIGFGIRGDTSDSDLADQNSVVMFDNIQLVLPYTPQAGQLTADFTGDGIINFADFAIMGQEWHRCGQADIYPDCIVDLMDLEVLAEEWLK